MGLTKRWFDLPDKVREHDLQTNLLKSLRSRSSMYYVIAAGRRSFKTERFLKRYFVHEIINKEGIIAVLGAPTRQQAKSIFWRDIKALIPQHLILGKPRESDLEIELTNGSRISVVGLESHQRLQGSIIHLFGCTEAQLIDPSVFTESIQPSINDTGGQAILEGRPLYKNHFWEWFNRGKDENFPEWECATWKSSDILSSEQIKRAKVDLTKADYAREYNASFETSVSVPYYAYSTKNHAVMDIDPKQPIYITCDFNATEKPMAWAIAQPIITADGMRGIYVHKEFVSSYTNTLTQCGIVGDYLKYKFGNRRDLDLRFYGDFAGNNNTSNSTSSDWEIIEQNFRNYGSYVQKTQKTKNIRDTISSTNTLMENALDQHRLLVNAEKCPELVKDWTRCYWKDNGRELDESDALRGHICRAVDYMVHYEFPVYGNTKTVVDHGVTNVLNAPNVKEAPKGKRVRTKMIRRGITVVL